MKPFIPHSAIRLTLEPFLSILVIVLLASFYPLTPSLSQTDPTGEWHLLYLRIRDSQISKGEALARLRNLEPLLKDLYLKSWNQESNVRSRFPLKGYGPGAVGGRGGSGYQPEGYDFFGGNRHKGHPGHDIFIRDKNQDSLDDGTGKPVEVVSVSPGIVVSVNLDWDPSSPVRGGNYIWVYDLIKSRYSTMPI